MTDVAKEIREVRQNYAELQTWAQRWFVHVTRPNGSRPYAITIRCSGHLIGEGMHRPPLARAILFPDGWNVVHKKTGAGAGTNSALIDDKLLDGALFYPGSPSEFLESTLLPPCATPPPRSLEGSLRARGDIRCQCGQAVITRRFGMLQRAFDQLALRGRHTCDLDDLRTLIWADIPAHEPQVAHRALE